eukprot:NODE_230_length_12188_cov_0.969890.p3 type:complete len:477 gc:universal NODE_230_length_12188_cov_0.969890:3895-2465(-)
MSMAAAFEGRIGESLLVRSQFISSFKQLGPPDHMHIINSDKDVMAGDKTDGYKQSCFLHLVGLDNSSVSSMAATIARILNSQNIKAWFEDQSVIKGTLSTFNPFSAVDVRVQVSLPGGVHSYGVNQQGHEVKIEEFSELFWHELYVVSVLRSYTLDVPVSSTLGPLFRENVFPDERSIIKFLKSAHYVYSESSTTFAVNSEDGNFLLFYIKKILNDLGRNDLMLDWIEGSKYGLPKLYYDRFIKVAYLQGLINTQQEQLAFNELAEIFDYGNNHEDLSSVLHFEFHYLKAKSDFKSLQIVSKMLIKISPQNAKVWLDYATILIKLREFGSALIVLNSCPMIHFDDEPKIEFYRTLKPSARYCPIRENIDLLEELTLIPDGTDSKYLKKQRQYQSMPKFLKLAYGILVNVVEELSWDGFLELRNLVFVMEQQNLIDSEDSKRLCERWLDDLFIVFYFNIASLRRFKNVFWLQERAQI